MFASIANYITVLFNMLTKYSVALDNIATTAVNITEVGVVKSEVYVKEEKLKNAAVIADLERQLKLPAP